MTRELKLALIVGFSLVLAVTVLISDHLSKARQVRLAEVSSMQPAMTVKMVAEPPAGTLPGNEEPPVPLPPSANQHDSEPAAPALASNTLPVHSAGSEVVQINQTKKGSAGTATEGSTRAADRKPTAQPGNTQLALNGTAGPRVVDNSATNDVHRDLVKEAERLGFGVRNNNGTLELVPNGNGTGLSGKSNPTSEKPKELSKDAGKDQTKLGTKSSIAPVPGEKAYIVVDGDNFTKVAKKVYGDGAVWKKLAAANGDRVKGDSLRVGMTLRVPPLEALNGKPASPALASGPGKSNPTPEKTLEKPADKSPEKAAPKKSEKASEKKPVESSKVRFASYTVKKGDTLGTIAQRTLGSATRADELVKVNSSLQDDVDNIQVGAVIKVPQS